MKEHSLGYLMSQVLRVQRKLIALRFREQGLQIGFDQFAILYQMSKNKDFTPTQQDLANELMKDKSLILRQVNLLIEAGFVLRTCDTDDKRKKTLEMTELGVLEFERARKISGGVSETLLVGVPEAEVVVFRNALLKMLENGGLEGICPCADSTI
jgi:DNA-binding MarR family transcriptional regulator